LIRELTEKAAINVIFGKGQAVLEHAEFFEPVRNLLHAAHHRLERQCYQH